MKFKIITLLICLFSSSVSFSQRTCATVELVNKKIQSDDSYKGILASAIESVEQYRLLQNKSAADTLIIPVVVHVIWNSAAEKVSLQQIQSQIRILNEDYSKKAGTRGHNVNPVGADTKIKFALAVRTPQNQTTTGIIYTQTARTSFDPLSGDEGMKFASEGGADAWPRNSYLNMWICHLEDGLLGFASLPGEPASQDGVVIDFRAFGDVGTAQDPFDLGRTATHEIGHWLGLFHIWGDDDDQTDECSFDDGINDTPLQANATAGCPSGTRTDACTTTSPGIMYQNYMDYSNDACMNIFTLEQSNVMRGILNNQRNSLKSSMALVPVSTYAGRNALGDIRIFPNPGNGLYHIQSPVVFNELYVEVFDLTGEQLIQRNTIADHKIDLSELANGLYFVKISDGANHQHIEKLSLMK